MNVLVSPCVLNTAVSGIWSSWWREAHACSSTHTPQELFGVVMISFMAVLFRCRGTQRVEKFPRSSRPPVRQRNPSLKPNAVSHSLWWRRRRLSVKQQHNYAQAGPSRLLFVSRRWKPASRATSTPHSLLLHYFSDLRMSATFHNKCSIQRSDSPDTRKA